MPIPQDHIETPEVVWASAGETLEQVRARLKGPDGLEKWQACVLVRSQDDRYAVASVFDLRLAVWNEGPTALQRPLQDLELLRFQPGIEEDASDLQEAERLARQYGGYLVVLRGGKYAGLVRDRSMPRSTLIKPAGAFDLFDELIADSDLARTEFVTATPNTTVALIARKLKSLQDAETAYIVVQKGDDTFGVMPTQQLQAETKRLGEQIWGMPVRDFATLLQAAPARERRLLGIKQAQAVANSQGYLVLTENGQPVGLLPSRVSWRGLGMQEAVQFGIAKGIAADLYEVSEDLISDVPDEVPPEKKPRYANLWLADSAGVELSKTLPLTLRQAVRLKFNIGQPRPESIVTGVRPPIAEPPAMRESLGETPEGTTLYVSVFSNDFDIRDGTQSLLLPSSGDSVPIEFEVTPLRSTFGPDDRARLDLTIYYRCNLVQSWQVQAEVVTSPGTAAQSDTPQVALLLATRTEDYMSLDEIGPRQLSMEISKSPSGTYQFDMVVAAGPSSDEVKFHARVNLRREDLTHLITKSRRQFYNISRSTAYQDNVKGDALTFRRATQALALLGRQLYSHLFEQDGPDSSARDVANWIKENLPPGSTLQVIDRAGDFVFPWALVYDEVPWDRDGLSTKVDPTGFWGVRFKIELLTDDLIRTHQARGGEMDTTAGLRVGVGLNEEIPWSREQRGFFDELNAECGGLAEYGFFDTSPELTEFLEKGNRHVFYVFCHGYTERMAADIQLADDLVGEFKAWVNTLPEEQQTALAAQQEDWFDVSDSWIKLTYGTVPLTMMEYYAAPRLDYGPLVFLNMCESAQVLPSLSGGFIPFFLQRGARCVIGTECPMTSTFADPFARAFFRRFLQGEAVGDILWALRQDYMQKGNPLGLAYTLYGDAGTKLDQAVIRSQMIGKETNMANETVEQQVNKLWLKPEEDLYVTLGINQQAVVTAQEENDSDKLEKAQQYDTVFSATDTQMGALDDLKDFGKRWWAALEPRLYDVLCNRENPQHDELMKALADGAKMLAVALAPALVAPGVVPAVAVVVATIAAKKIYESGMDVACQMWKESLDEKAQPG